MRPRPNIQPSFKPVLIAETGICAGTMIATLDGDMPVEHLTAGDRVVTRDCGVATLLAVKARRAKVQPVTIKGGSLGHSRPDTDMIVPPGTCIHIRDWRASALFGQSSANISASRLADGEFVSKGPWQVLLVYELHFATDQILYADGVEIAIAA